jgi:hypothetical protein
MSKAHFEVEACFDGANKLQKGTVTIDRDRGLISVRVHRRHDEDTITLAAVAEWIYKKSKLKQAMEGKKPRKKLARRGLLTAGR